MREVRKPDPRAVYERELLYREAVSVVIDLLDSQGLSRRELAERLGVSEPRLSRVLSGRENLTLRTVADLGWALGIRFELAPIPFEDRTDTPAAKDLSPPDWLDRRRRGLARTSKAESPPPQPR